LHQHRRLADAEPGAAISFGHCDAEPAVARARLLEFARELAALVVSEPVVGVEALAELRDRVANAFLLGRERKIHEKGSEQFIGYKYFRKIALTPFHQSTTPFFLSSA